MNLLVISLAPVFTIAFYIYLRDKYEKEPLRLLLLAMVSGGLTVVPVFFAEGFLEGYSSYFPGLMKAAWRAFVVAGFTEELFKFLVLYVLIWRSPEFNEKFDGIVYAVFISLGFAAVENVLYVTSSGFSTGITRAITAVPAHAVFGITMGFFFGMAKFYPGETRRLKQKALLYPVLLHGIYDFILFTEIAWLSIVFAGFVVFLYFSGFKRMKKLSNESIYKTDFKLLNEKFTKSQ